jgi:putative endonuclease
VRGGCFVPRSDITSGDCFGLEPSQRHGSKWIMAVGREYCVYIMTNAHNTVLYTGVTNDLARRVYEHKNGLGSTFVKKYNVHKLVYYEVGDNIHSAIAREKQIKGGSRQKKIDLINSLNPEWKDLYEEIK